MPGPRTLDMFSNEARAREVMPGWEGARTGLWRRSRSCRGWLGMTPRLKVQEGNLKSPTLTPPHSTFLPGGQRGSAKGLGSELWIWVECAPAPALASSQPSRLASLFCLFGVSLPARRLSTLPPQPGSQGARAGLFCKQVLGPNSPHQPQPLQTAVAGTQC